MEEVLLKAFTFIFIIGLGWVLKKKNIFKREDGIILGKIVLRITLPAAILSNASKLSFSSTSFILIITAFTANLVFASMGKHLFSKGTKVEQGSAMINSSGFNIGNITIPFAVAFFPGAGMTYLAMFDIGNSISWMGGVYAWASSIAKDDGSKVNIRGLVSVLSKMMPFLTYMLMIVLSILKLSLPSQIHSIIYTIGSANTFLVFFMIGVLLDINMDKKQLVSVIKILSIRFVGLIIFSLIVYFILPIPILAKQVTILCLASAIPGSATVFCTDLNDDSALPALVNSLAIIVSLIYSSIVLMLFV